MYPACILEPLQIYVSRMDPACITNVFRMYLSCISIHEHLTTSDPAFSINTTQKDATYDATLEVWNTSGGPLIEARPRPPPFLWWESYTLTVLYTIYM